MAYNLASSGKDRIITRNTRLRHLKLKSWSQIVEVLSVGNRWLEIASKIKRPNSENEFLYSPTDISTLENQVKKGQLPAEAFLEHWSTTGVKQPTVGDLLNLLVDAQLLQAADTLSQHLGVSNTCTTPDDPPFPSSLVETNGSSVEKSDSGLGIDEPTLVIDSVKPEKQLVQYQIPPRMDIVPEPAQIPVIPREDEFIQLDCFSSLQYAIMRSTTLNYRYKYLAEISGNFCDISVHQGGYKLGEGAFGVVYRACAEGQWVAIKRLKDAVDTQFINELEVLSRFKHENLLPLLGYSDDGPYCCLVYLFMLNGSLQERLACTHGTMPLSWKTRMAIACGTAKGINHLHTFGKEPLVHRDIKSANVLLDKDLVPKVGDFGLARIGSSGTSSTVALTSNIYGTSVYMAREAFNGEVSIKLDTFSFGVVLLELLTGLPPFDPSREETDLISFMEEKCDSMEDVLDLLDVRAGDWDKKSAISLYEIARHCLEIRKKDRPTLAQVLPALDALLKC